MLANEVGVVDTADPLGGSYFIEALTDELEERALELIGRIDELGGAVAAIESGFVQGEIEAAAYEWTSEVESGERTIVGVNAFTEDGEPARIELHRLDPRLDAAPARAHAAASGPSGTRRRRAQRSPPCARRRAGAATCCRRSATRSPRVARSARSATVLREEWGEHDRRRAGA